MQYKLQLGVIASLQPKMDEEFQKMRSLDLSTCQIACWAPELYTEQIAADLKQSAEQYGITVTSLWTGYPGPAVWNFIDGPATLGFLPPEWREARIDALIKGAEFAVKIGAPSITTHAGFIPENPKDPLYAGVVSALKVIALKCKELGLGFWFETGQETPVTLLRLMHDIGTDNLGVNLDPANLLMYGKANPVDALDVFGKYVRGVHAKDGDYPTEPNNLGEEKPLGAGRVNFPALIPKLKSMGYQGALTIEREISGDQQILDIKKAIELLSPLL